MVKLDLNLSKIQNIQTPFYYYDMDLLRETLKELNRNITNSPFVVHYALKANVNVDILREIRIAGLGADCVSGGEIKAAIEAGVSSGKIVFAGVGKADWEINLALEEDIFCFNVESLQELDVINSLAKDKNKEARITLRINPNIKANTHHYITTGLNENKFGLNMSILDKALNLIRKSSNLKLIGIHFHIGSQITDMQSFVSLCNRINEMLVFFNNRNVILDHINVGGGLGVDYEYPDAYPVPDFESYFNVFRNHLNFQPHQTVHFELGRSIVAQCGNLISKVLYLKEGVTKKFVVLDAGFTDLIRPTLYQAYHRIENLSSEKNKEKYEIVGPICESSDIFAKEYIMNKTERGDIVALRTAGAYGEVMASTYNLRNLPKAYYSDCLG